jgi:hypothetical protein
VNRLLSVPYVLKFKINQSIKFFSGFMYGRDNQPVDLWPESLSRLIICLAAA